MDKFDWHIEQNRRRGNKEKAEHMKAAAKHYEPSLEEFRDSPVHASMVDKAKSFLKRREHLLTDEKPYQASAIEHLVQFGIAQKRLFEDHAHHNYSAEPIWVNQFDDVSNRIDAAFFLHCSPEGNSAGEQFDCPIALDVTTSSDPDIIREKILIGSNDPLLCYHAGFTEIHFCKDRANNRTIQKLVPKYCVGASPESVDDLLERTHISESGIPNYESATANITSFKLIYEILQQNDLFCAPLYLREDQGTITEEESKALRRLEMVQNIYISELERLAQNMPQWLTSQLGAPKNEKDYDVEQIAALFLDENNPNFDPTFHQITNTVGELLDGIDNSNDNPDYLVEQGLIARDKKAQNRTRPAPKELIERNHKVAWNVYRARVDNNKTVA